MKNTGQTVNKVFLKKLNTFGLRIWTNIKSDNTAERMNYSFHVDKMCGSYKTW